MKKKNRLLRFAFVLAFLVSLGLGNELWAATWYSNGAVTLGQTTNWNSATDGTGTTLGSWTTTDDYVVEGTDVLTFAAVTFNSLTINSTGTHVTHAGPAVGNVTVGASCNFSNAASMAITGTLAVNPGVTLTQGNDLTVSSIVTVNGTIATSTYSLTVSGATSISNTGTISGTTGNKTFTGAVTNAGNVTMTGGATITFSAAYSGSGNINTVTGTNITIGGAGVAATVALPASITTMGTLSLPAATAAKVVTIAGDITIATLTPGVVSGGTNTVTIASGKTLTITNGYTGAAGNTLDASGANVVFNNTTNFAAGTLTTTSGTSLTVNGAVTSFPAITALNNLTVGAALTLTGPLTLAGNLTVSDGVFTFATGNFNLTVNGTYNNAGITAATHSILNIGATGTLTLNGPISDWGFSQASLTSTVGTSNLVIGGSGTIAAFPAATAGVGLPTVTMNRANTSLDLSSVGQTVTFQALTITSGTIATGGTAVTVTTTTSIAVAGTLSGSTGNKTFTGAVTNAGNINMTDAGTLLFGDAYSGAGNINTVSTTNITINAPAVAATVALPSSITTMGTLLLPASSAAKNITLAGDITINTLTPTTATVANTVTIASGKTLTITTAYTGAAFNVLVATGATVKFGNTANFTAGTLTVDATSSLTFANTVTALPAVSVKNLTITSGTTTMGGNVTIASTGTLSLAGTLVVGAYTLTCDGTFTGAGTLTASNAASAVVLSGIVNFAGTYTGLGNAAGSTLTINGTYSSSNITLPTIASGLESLTINRAGSIVKLGGNLGVYATTNAVVLTNGTLDLNGKNITLVVPTASIVTNINNVINTGDAATGYILLPSTTAVLAAGAGMGLTTFTGGADNIAITTYFASVSTPGGASVKKYWEVTTDGTGTLDGATVSYGTNDNVPNGTLYIYKATSAANLATGTQLTLDNTTKIFSGAGVGISTTAFFTAALGTTTGTGASASATGNWSDGTKWSGTGGSIPSTTQDVLVNGTYTMTVDQDATCANLTIAGDGIVKVAPGKTLTVTGNLIVTSNQELDLTTLATESGATLIVGGSLPDAGTDILTDARSIIQLNGNTTTTLVNEVGGRTVHTLTIAKENANVSLSGGALTVAGSSTLNVLTGTLIVGDVDLTVTGTTYVAAGATLDGYTNLASNKSINFNGPITGAGSIVLSGAAGAIRSTYFNNTLTFTGLMTTNEYSAIVSGTGTETYSITLPSSVETIASLVINKASTASVTLSNDLDIAGVLTLTSGKLIGGANSITVGGAYSGTANGTFNLSGTTLTFNGVTHPDFTTGTPVHVTNSLTNITVNTTQVGDILFPTNITELNALTVNIPANRTFTNNNNLTLAGPLTITSGTYVPGNYLLTVGGAFTMANSANAVLTETNAELVLNGPISIGNAANLAFDDPAFDLTIGGTGAISIVAPTTSTTIRNLTMNRSGATFNLTASGAFTLAGDLTITNGTVDMVSPNTYAITGSSVISSGGKLVRNVNTGLTFNGAFSGAGTFDANTAVVTVNGAYNYTGNFITNTSTQLYITGTTANGDAILQSSIADLHTLSIIPTNGQTRNVTLSGDLKVASSLVVGSALGVSTLTVGANTLEVTPIYTGVASGTLNVSNSTVKFTGIPDFTLGTLTTNNATNFDFVGGVTTYPATSNNINDIKFGGNSTLPAADMTINGNLEIYGGTLTTAANKTINITGMFSNAGTFSATNLTNINIYGGMSGSGIWTTPENINLTVLGSANQLNLPNGIIKLNKLVLNRANGAKINVGLVINATGPALILTNGDLDLNGYNITLGTATTQITENMAGGATVINTGSDGAYVTTPATTSTNIVASGIGVSKFTTTDAAAQVKRFPKARRIAGVNISVARYFQVIAPTTMPSEIEFKYDNTELGTNSAGSMKVYTVATSTDNFLTLSVIDSSSSTTNTPGDATGKVWAKSFSGAIATGDYFALASVSGSTSLVRIFNNAAGTNRWENASNWYPTGVPTKDDDVVIGPYPVTIAGNGIVYYAKSLSLESPSSALVPASAISSGDTVKLVVMGNINIQNAGGNIDGANNYGRLNIQIGDGLTPVTSTLTPSQDYSPLAGANGFSAYNLILNNAAVNQAGAFKIRVSKDVNIEGTSVFGQATNSTLVMYGGSGTQAINVASIASLELQNLELENAASVTTSSNFTVKQNIKLDGPNDNLIANNGIIRFQNAGAVDGWNVFPGAVLKLWQVAINADFNYAPVGDAQIQGDFTYSNVTNDETFSPVNGTVLFTGANQKNIVNTAGAEDLLFNNLAVAIGSSVLTSSSFYVKGDIDVKTNASLIADNGTITFPATAPTPSYIKNASNRTLVFNNLTVADEAYTSDSWKISGNLNVSGILSADAGTITFQNDVAKSIVNTGTLNFFKASVADRATITTVSSFNVRNNATTPSGSGLEILGTGSFTSTTPSVVTFTVDTDPGVGAVKTITKASGATLKLYQLEVANAVNNNVTTASDFELTGTTNTFRNHNAGLGGFFTATAGTITFSGTAPTIVSALADVTTMNNILVNDVALTLTAANYLNLTGNITVNGTNGVFNTATNAAGLLKFNGTAQQNITGTSTQITPVTLDRVEINKTNGSTTDKSVVMELDVLLRDNANTLLRLNSGYLNLGSKKLTNGLGTVTYTHLGAINGATGTFYNVANQDGNVLLRDELFTVDNVPTLYNWTMGHAATLDGNLTVNGTLSLDQAAANVLTIGSYTLTQIGNVTRTTGLIATATGKLVLTGTGSVSNFSNNYFGTSCNINLEIARAEALVGNLTIADGKELVINTGINVFNIDINKLTTLLTATINRISGSITAGTNSTVDLGTGIATIPANLFTNNTCYNLVLTGNPSSGRYLASDLRIEGTLSGTLQNITTGDNNVLTFGPTSTLPAFSSAAHIIGNLRRTVTSNATKYDVGDGTPNTFRPLELNFATSGSIQEITVSTKNVEPTIGRVGNPKNAVDVLYTFTPVGTNVNDSLKTKYQWAATLEGNGLAATVTNGSFPAKWENGVWNDYRDKLSTFTSASPRILTMSGFPIANPSALKGEWAIFNATANTDAAKDKAISKTENKVVITKINPTPVELNKPFKVTVQLQDQYGQPITVTAPFAITVSQEINPSSATLTGTTLTGVITAGNSMVELTGVYSTAGANVQLKADTTGGSDNWQPTVSNPYNVLATAPSIQATSILLTNITNTTATINWTNATSNTLIVIKADTLLIEGQEYPVSGTSYTANSLFGAGSPLGNAVVINKVASPAAFTVKGLSPNTKYYVYAFAFNGSNGTENYMLVPALGNPKILNTTGSTDDDVAFGTNNTRLTSKTIGTNTPVTGTINSSSDEDWFNFSVTSTSPNVRTQLSGLANNYNIEVYDMAGRRIRRGIRTATGSEGPVVNNLPAGTYTVRIYSADGSYSATNTYTLKVGTKSSEIFSVTP